MKATTMKAKTRAVLQQPSGVGFFVRVLLSVSMVTPGTASPNCPYAIVYCL